LLALLLIAGGSVGLVHAKRPCWLGFCARITLSSTAINFTNDESQTISITNTGNSDLHWVATLETFYPWLTVSPNQGTLAPQASTTLTISSKVDNIEQGDYPDILTITGDTGVIGQKIVLMEKVGNYLGVSVDRHNFQTFIYAQGQLKPSAQTITLSNHSGHLLLWNAQYFENNLLSVTPNQGTLADAHVQDLTVTVISPQNLPSNNYQAIFSLEEQLDNQPTVLPQTELFSFTVQVSQTATPTITPSPTPSSPFSFTAQQLVSPSAPNQMRAGHSMVWDAQNSQLLIFGGTDGQGNLFNDLWSYNPSNALWTNLTPANTTATPTTGACNSSSPAPRMNAAMVWDSIDQQVLLYGGQGANNSYLSDLWSYAPAQGKWTALACASPATTTPGARAGAGVAWNGSQMLLFGGFNPGGILSDFWAYTPGASGTWSQLATSTALGALAYPTMSWDSQDRQLYLFGGGTASGQQSGTLAVYQPGGSWTLIKPKNADSAPLPRQQALSAWDSKDQVFLMIGGWDANSTLPLNVLWSYSPNQHTWWENPEPQVGSRLASMMVWDNTTNRGYIYAGINGIGPNNPATKELWMISQT
ncbi:MAG: Kelch repeat-containing protein, partial [Ktedonobacteraceae bacterium]